MVNLEDLDDGEKQKLVKELENSEKISIGENRSSKIQKTVDKFRSSKKRIDDALSSLVGEAEGQDDEEFLLGSSVSNDVYGSVSEFTVGMDESSKEGDKPFSFDEVTGVGENEGEGSDDEWFKNGIV